MSVTAKRGQAPVCVATQHDLKHLVANSAANCLKSAQETLRLMYVLGPSHILRASRDRE